MKNNIDTLEDLQCSINTLILKGRKFFKDKNIDEAFKFFDKALQLNKHYGEIYLNKGEMCMKNFHIEKGERYIKKYLRVKKDIMNTYLDMIDKYIIDQNYNKALDLCNKIIKRNLANYIIYYKKAYILIQLREVNNALTCYNKCVNLEPNFYDGYYQKGNILTGLCKHKEAINCYSKAIKIDSTKTDAYIGSALAYMDLEDYPSALPFMETACIMDPNNNWCKLYYNLIKNSINKNFTLKKIK